MTYSIVARDEWSGDLGVAVQSRALAVGAVVPWARAGVGAVATQSDANPRYGSAGLRLLSRGKSVQAVLTDLVGDDDLRAERQVGIVDARGESVTFTGEGNPDWAGGRAGHNYAAQGNVCAGPQVIDRMIDTLLGRGQPFPELLIECLRAADAAGGDRRGRQSAALLVVRPDSAFGGLSDRYIDLRVDDAREPIDELRRLLDLHRLYHEGAREADLLPMDAPTAADVKIQLRRWGLGEGGVPRLPMKREDIPVAGETTAFPFGWDEAWQEALVAFLTGVNLWRRNAAPGWIDRRVLETLRGAAVDLTWLVQDSPTE